MKSLLTDAWAGFHNFESYPPNARSLYSTEQSGRVSHASADDISTCQKFVFIIVVCIELAERLQVNRLLLSGGGTSPAASELYHQTLSLSSFYELFSFTSLFTDLIIAYCMLPRGEIHVRRRCAPRSAGESTRCAIFKRIINKKNKATK